VTPRKDREGYGGDSQQLVLAFFASEDAADEAAKTLRDWEKATDYMKVDAIGVLVTDKNGKVPLRCGRTPNDGSGGSPPTSFPGWSRRRSSTWSR
jgi:hypothetical protein